MPSDVMRDVTLGEVTPRAGKGALGTWRVFGAVPRRRARSKPQPFEDRPMPACKPRSGGANMSQHLSFLGTGKAAGVQARVRTVTREIRPCGIVGGPGETWLWEPDYGLCRKT